MPQAGGEEEGVENYGREYHGTYLSLSHVRETQNLSLSLARDSVLAGHTELRVAGTCERDTTHGSRGQREGEGGFS
jgi:hypothetical protein